MAGEEYKMKGLGEIKSVFDDFVKKYKEFCIKKILTPDSEITVDNNSEKIDEFVNREIIVDSSDNCLDGLDRVDKIIEKLFVSEETFIEAMDADIAGREAREDAGESDYDAIWYQGDYIKELVAETNYPSFDVEGACMAFKEWKGHKKENIMGFRDNSYKSVITGTMAPIHHTKWVEEMDDSLECYLKN